MSYTSTHSTQNSNNSASTSFICKYKTEKCRYWYEQGFCPYDQYCAFAHCEQELRGKQFVNSNYKTKMCANFKAHGFCKYGDRCQFKHGGSVTDDRIIENNQQINIHSSRYSECDLKPTRTVASTKHQTHLSLLGEFGLELIGAKMSRSNKWRAFIEEGIETKQQVDLLDFQESFPDYNFHKKPRLFSM